jgi:hypothetical protein
MWNAEIHQCANGVPVFPNDEYDLGFRDFATQRLEKAVRPRQSQIVNVPETRIGFRCEKAGNSRELFLQPVLSPTDSTAISSHCISDI